MMGGQGKEEASTVLCSHGGGATIVTWREGKESPFWIRGEGNVRQLQG